jgi:hypothetical protein
MSSRPAVSPCCPQRAVEENYVKKGLIIGRFHKSYWMGLTADVWPMFYWTDSVTACEPSAGPGAGQLCICVAVHM